MDLISSSIGLIMAASVTDYVIRLHSKKKDYVIRLIWSVFSSAQKAQIYYNIHK